MVKGSSNFAFKIENFPLALMFFKENLRAKSRLIPIVTLKIVKNMHYCGKLFFLTMGMLTTKELVFVTDPTC